MHVLFEPLSGMKGLITRHQNIVPFCPESESNNQNWNCDTQHSAKLIYVTHVLAFDIMQKQIFFAIMTSDASSVWTTFRCERIKSEASKFIANLSWIRILPSKLELLPTTLNKIDWCDSCLSFWYYAKTKVFRINDLTRKLCLNHFPVWND